MTWENRFAKYEKDFGVLSKAFIVTTEAAKGVSGRDGRYADAEALLIKLFGHASTAFVSIQVARRVDMRSMLNKFAADFTDFWSLDVLCRAAWETFLVFHYVYIEPNTDDLKDFRYLAWRLGSLLERQKFPIEIEKELALRVKTIEKREINKIKKRLAKNPIFASKKEKGKKDILEHGKWKYSSWREIALSAGINEIQAGAFYAFLCGRAHSNNLTVYQISLAKDEKTRKELCLGGLGTILIAMAYMADAFSGLFPKAKVALNNHEDCAEVIHKWKSVGGGRL